MAGARYSQVLHLGVVGACIVRIGCFSSHTGQLFCRQHNTFSATEAPLERWQPPAQNQILLSYLSSFVGRFLRRSF